MRRSGRFARAMRLLERAMLGRSSSRPTAAVAAAVKIAADPRWCTRCGAPLRGSSPMPTGVRPGLGPSCAGCRSLRGLAGFVRLARYRRPLDAIIRRSKAHADHGTLLELGRRLGREVACRLAPPAGGWCVVPVPASTWRRLLRGVDHAHVIAQGVASELGTRPRSAARAGVRGRQASLARRDRWRLRHRLRATFGAAAGIRGRHVLLVDDVRTTGATLLAAAALIRQLGAASVSAAVVAVADEDA